MFDALGLGGGNSLLAGAHFSILTGSIAEDFEGLGILLGIPFPVWIYYKGEAVRLRSSLSRKP